MLQRSASRKSFLRILLMSPAFYLQSLCMGGPLSTDSDWNGTVGRAVNEDAGGSGSRLGADLDSDAFLL